MSRTRLSSRRGANAIEFALVLPVMVALMGGIIEYGWYFHREVVLEGVVQDVTRVAATTPTTDQRSPQKVAEDELVARLDALGYEGPVNLSVQVTGHYPDARLDVGVALPNESLLGFTSYVPKQLVSTASMRLEDQPQ